MLKFYGKEVTRELLEKTDNALGIAHDEQLLDKLSNPVICDNILRTYHRLLESHTNADIEAQPFSLAPLILESAGVEVSKEALMGLADAIGKHPDKKIIQKIVGASIYYGSKKIENIYKLENSRDEKDSEDEDDEGMAYVNAALILHLAKRLNEQNLRKMLAVIDAEPDGELIKKVLDRDGNSEALAEIDEQAVQLEKMIGEAETDREAKAGCSDGRAYGKAVSAISSSLACEALSSLGLVPTVAGIVEILSAANIREINLHMIEELVKKERLEEEFAEQIYDLWGTTV